MSDPGPTHPLPPLVPATFFGMVLGLGGLGSAWRVLAGMNGSVAWIAEALCLAAVAIWLAWLVLFAAKWLRAPVAARAEASDQAMGFAIGLVPMATLLVSVLLKPLAPLISWLIYVPGLIGGVAFTAWVMGNAWRGGRPLAATTPLMYLSPVGAGFLGAMGAAAHGHDSLAAMLWGAGAISWLMIESAVLQRLMSEPMPVAQRALVGIQLAPPAVGCMSYLAITAGPVDRIALMLLGYAMLQAIILLRLVPWLREQPFGPGAWGYTFGVAALSVSTLTMFARDPGDFLLALATFLVANLLVGWIALRTIRLALAGRLFPAWPTPK